MNSSIKEYLPVIFLICFLIVIIYFFTPKLSPIFRNSSSVNNNHQLIVTTSFYPLYFFASQVGGNKAQVQNITPSGAEPHDYDPSTQDIARIENSNLLILNGGVEAWGDKIRDNLAGTKVVIVTAGQGLLTQQVTEDNQTQIDPHVWLDPMLAKKEVQTITQGFIKVDPANIAYYRTNEKSLDAKLDQLDNEYRTGMANCQEKNIVTSHAAFGYLATRYGLHQVPIAGLSPDAEPSAKQLADIANFARQNNIKYIFFESLVSPKISQTIASEVGAQTMVLDPIEGVSDLDMKAGKNYLTIMENNLHNLQIALRCHM